MDTDTTYSKDLSERRFRTLFFVLRLAAVPCNMKNISIAHVTYNVVVVVCYCLTFFSVTMDIIVNRQYLEETMNNVRAAYILAFSIWTHFSVRYVSSQSIVMLAFLQYFFTNIIIEPG